MCDVSGGQGSTILACGLRCGRRRCLKGRLNSRIWGRDAEYRGNDAKIWFGKIMATSLKGCVVDLQDIVRWPVVSANSWIRTSKGRAAIGSGRTGMRDVLVSRLFIFLCNGKHGVSRSRREKRTKLKCLVVVQDSRQRGPIQLTQSGGLFRICSSSIEVDSRSTCD
jgi:hypothetical protein